MTVSVKPFGCMPSSGVSDGVQSLITARYPGSIFCAVETSGDGATNFYSRVQMYMFKARLAAEQELSRAYQEQGVTETDVRAFLEANPSYASPLHHAPHSHVYAGSAANLVAEVAPLIKKTRAERAREKVVALADAFVKSAKAAPAKAATLLERARDPEVQAALREDALLVADLFRGKAKERFGPLVERLAKKAYLENNAELGLGYNGEPVAAE
jgi:hypothetical protein